MQQQLSLRDRLDRKIFDAIWSRSLVYNTCWEDPAVDRKALDLGPNDTVLVITSAGCNALDYALQSPHAIHCVDANPRQNALLELKIAAIRELEYDAFFALFGDGYHEESDRLYRQHLRSHLSPFARDWWDRHMNWFTSRRGSFYFHSLSGLVARGVRAWLRTRPALRDSLSELLAARSLDEQQRIYDNSIEPQMWSRFFNWAVARPMVMNLLGVPHPQRRLVEAQHPDGIAGYIRASIRYVFRQLPLADNYFWRLYLTGRYSRDCCPEYLKPEGFAHLKRGGVDCLQLHTQTVTGFLQEHPAPISRFVLLDHMDWMSTYYPKALAEEWEAILARATPRARILVRSAQAQPAWLDQVRVGHDQLPLRQCLQFHDELAQSLQPSDRVHTYPGFVIADAPA